MERNSMIWSTKVSFWHIAALLFCLKYVHGIDVFLQMWNIRQGALVLLAVMRNHSSARLVSFACMVRIQPVPQSRFKKMSHPLSPLCPLKQIGKVCWFLFNFILPSSAVWGMIYVGIFCFTNLPLQEPAFFL